MQATSPLSLMSPGHWLTTLQAGLAGNLLLRATGERHTGARSGGRVTLRTTRTDDVPSAPDV